MRNNWLIQNSLRNGKLPLTICVIAVLIQLGGGEVGEWLRYDRNDILSGEVWRIFSGHLVHLGWSHLIMNICGLAFVWLLFGHLIKPSTWLWISVASAAGISSAMMLFDPMLEWYVGFSGVLHGMLIAGIVISININTTYRAELLLLLLLLAKLFWEQLIGPLPGSANVAEGKVIVDAHLYGAISGLVASLFLFNNTFRRVTE